MAQRALVRTCVVLATLLAPALGHAATIEWRAPRGCPDAASMKSRIEQRLGQSLDEVLVTVEVDVSRAGGRYTARIDLGAVTVANDVRTLTSRRCGELADAVAVIIARVASDALARDVTPAVAVAAAAMTVATAPSSDAVRDDDMPRDRGEPAESTSAPKHRAWAIGARLSGISGIGVIPQVGLGGELAVTVRAGRHLAELGAARWVASAAQFHDGAPAKVNVELDVTLVRYGWRPAALPLRAWVAVEVGTMRGDGVVLPTAQIEAGRWIAAGTGFGIAWQMTPMLRLVGTTEAMLAVDRVRFSVGQGMTVYAPAPMSVRTTCGLEVGWQ